MVTPRTVFFFIAMCKSRAQFKLALRHCKQESKSQSSDVLANKIVCKGDKRILERSEETDKVNYRLIAMTCVFSKLFELPMLSRIKKRL